jgi:hypothetical protein
MFGQVTWEPMLSFTTSLSQTLSLTEQEFQTSQAWEMKAAVFKTSEPSVSSLIVFQSTSLSLRSHQPQYSQSMRSSATSMLMSLSLLLDLLVPATQSSSSSSYFSFYSSNSRLMMMFSNYCQS